MASRQVLFLATAAVVAVACLPAPASAVVWKVGDEGGWRAKFNETHWTDGKTFRVGDSLLFTYPKDNHTLYEMGKDDFAACNVNSNGIKSWDSGNDTVALDKPGKRWFICTKAGHCINGMKLIVDVAYPTVNWKVGDEGGWRAKFNQTHWTDGKTFRVGDTLHFTYAKENHTLAEVGKEDFAACRLQGNPINISHTGDDIVTLDKTGKRWFICTVPHHCDGGMKLAVHVLDPHAPPVAPAPAPGPASPPGPSSSAPMSYVSAAAAAQAVVAAGAVVAAAFML
ncbi:hypothetical protein ACP70R_015323 [Stipagrostis hirtigluma subsp. patula]